MCGYLWQPKVAGSKRVSSSQSCFLVVAVAAVLLDDLDIPQLAAAHRDAPVGVDVSGLAMPRERSSGSLWKSSLNFGY